MEGGSLVIIEEELIDEDPLYTVTDKKVKNKARSTLPDILKIMLTNDSTLQFGVFAKCRIPYRTQFGPLDAPLTPYVTAKCSPFLMKSKAQKIQTGEVTMEINDDLYFDTSKEKHCNWMCMVRPGTNFEGQNMAAHFVNQDIYFTSTRRIEAKEELKIWYAPKYAQFMGLLIPPKVDDSNSISNLSEDGKQIRARRTRKPGKISSYVDYFEEDDDLDVRRIPPKKRGWRRASRPLLEESGKDEASSLSNIKINNNEMTSNLTNEPTDKINRLIVAKKRKKSEDKLNKEFVCSICGKQFAKQYTLKIHQTVHSDLYNFLCHTCGREFKRKDKLKEHIKRMHLSPNGLNKPCRKPGVNPRFVPRIQPSELEKFLFKCLRCSIGFHRRGMLVNHLSKRHPDIDVNSVPELALPILKQNISYMCPYCSKAYKSTSKRKYHIERHHPGESVPPGVRKLKHIPPSAGKIQAGIASDGVTAVDPVVCPYCDSQYSSKSKLTRHVSSKHTDKLTEFTNNQKKTRKIVKRKSKKIIEESDEESDEEAPSGGQDIVEFSNVKIIFPDVPPASFIEEDPDDTTSQHAIDGDVYIENQQSPIDNMEDIVEGSIVDLNPSNYDSQSMVTMTTATFEDNQEIDFIEEVTSVETYKSSAPIMHQEIQSTPIMQQEIQSTPIMQQEIQSTPIMQQEIQSTPIMQQEIQSTSIMQQEIQTTPIMQEHIKKPLKDAYRQQYNQPSRQLPLTYVRGRKYLLLQAMNDEKELNRAPRRPPINYSPVRNFTDERLDDPLPVVEITFNSRHTGASSATASHQYDVITESNPAGQTTTTMTSLPNCEMNWMY